MPSIFDEIEAEGLASPSLFDEIEREENERKRAAIAGGLETALQGIGAVQATQPFLEAQLGEMRKAAAEERRQQDIRRSFATTPMPGMTILTPEEAQGASQIIGGGLTQAGRNVRDTLAAGGYLATGDQPAALQQIVAPEAEKPLVEDIERLPLVPELAAKGAYGLAETAPRLAGMAAISAVAPPLAPAAGGLMFGFNEQGFSPEEAAIATVIPWVGSRSGGIVAAIAKKFGVESGQALRIWRMAGGTAGAAGYLGAIDASRIAGLAPEDREQAIRDFVASQMGFAVLGMIGGGHQPAMEAYRTGKRFGPPDPTRQQQEFLRSNLPQTQEPGVPRPQPVGVPNASEISKAATMGGDVRPQPIEGAGQMPIPESRPGVQPQAARGIPEAPQGGLPLEPPSPEAGAAPTPVPIPPPKPPAAPAAAPAAPAPKAAAPAAKTAPLVPENQLRLYPESDVASRIDKTRTAPSDSFMKEVEASGKSMTGDAWDLGISVKTQEQLDALMLGYQEAGINFREAIKQKDMKRASVEAFRGQYFREAYEAATGTGSAGLALKDVPGYKAPFPKTGAPEANKPVPTPSVEIEPPAAPKVAPVPEAEAAPAPVIESAFQKPKKREFGKAFERIGRDDVDTLLGDWNGSELSEDGSRIIVRDKRYGEGSYTHTKGEFFDWLFSDEATKVSTDPEWQSLVQRAREKASGGVKIEAKAKAPTPAEPAPVEVDLGQGIVARIDTKAGRIGYYNASGERVGVLETETGPNGEIMVKSHTISDEARGRGLGGTAIQKLSELTGKTIISDQNPSAAAAAMWDRIGAKRESITLGQPGFEEVQQRYVLRPSKSEPAPVAEPVTAAEPTPEAPSPPGPAEPVAPVTETKAPEVATKPAEVAAPKLEAIATTDGPVTRVVYKNAKGEEVGYGQLDGRVINYIEVKEPFRRTGIGTKIAEDLKARGGEIGVTTSEEASAMMRKAGFLLNMKRTILNFPPSRRLRLLRLSRPRSN